MEGYHDEGEEGKEGGEEEDSEEEEEVKAGKVHSLRSISLRRVAYVVGVVGTLVVSAAANAASITNRDDHDHKVTIIEGEAKADHVLKPSQVMQGICAKGCTIRLNDDEEDEYQLEPDDVVSIEEGSLYYDNPDAPAPPSPATDGKKGQQKG